MKISTLKTKISVSTFLTMASILSFASNNVIAQDKGDQCPDGKTVNNGTPCVQINERVLGFGIPTLAEILTFLIRLIFVAGGLAALVMLLLGALAWITSGGEKEKTKAAQDKIQAAVIGVILIAVVLAVVVTLEQVVFAGNICLGLSCGITIPALLKPAP